MKGKQMENIQYGIALEASASSLTQGNEFCWPESWGGLRGRNC